jgi:hypothetical protein
MYHTVLGLKLKGVFCKQLPYFPIVFQPILLLPGCHTNTDTHADANAITEQLSFGWLVGRLVGRSVGQSVGRSVGWSVSRSVSRLAYLMLQGHEDIDGYNLFMSLQAF